ncbi:hypothetical protein [Acetobacter cerevisiae]|uniref:hypothetical protein n=1 Tax=Acetobacter cerevisiae TaxID=178900 RepID=UPI00209CFC00|nr:hypothetical protein [Acetobacter cerevisiae]MCP1270937.1 hypothetical protein [Acetobacter cerevisiae]MCP1278832.1 hypothetical protein [Acetobacter cerevisiae]
MRIVFGKSRKLFHLNKKDMLLGGGGGSDGMDVIKYRLDGLEKRFDRLDVRLDKVDVRLDKIDDRHERDFRALFGALIAAVLVLAGLMAKGFHWL